MALEPKYEEQRDIRMNVVEAHLGAALRRHLDDGRFEVKVEAAPRPGRHTQGAQPRGSVIVKEAGLLGKKVAEFYSTGHWEIAPGLEETLRPVREELEKRILLETARANLSKARFSGGPPTTVAFDAPAEPDSYRSLLMQYLEVLIAELEAGLEGKDAGGLRARREGLEPRVVAARQAAPPAAWQRDLIPM